MDALPEISARDRASLVRDKYDGDQEADLTEDLEQLAAGVPLAYVIGWVPFLGLRIGLESRPLIPRPETEWWAELLIAHLRERFEERPLHVLDLCAGSGAIGLAVLAALPRAHVAFGELMPEHAEQIRKNLALNGLDAARADVRVSDLFAAFGPSDLFDVIIANPPYIPSARVLDRSVTDYEPAEALFSETDGLGIIRRIAQEAPKHLADPSELWLECDSEHAEAARALVEAGGAKEAVLHSDLYGRPRLVVGHY